MVIDRALVSGSMGMLILRLLTEKDMYGYEMIDTLRKRSQNVFELKAGTLYPLLHSLEEKQFLSVYEQEVLGKTRKYYRITQKGIKHLDAKKAEWQMYAKAVADVITAKANGEDDCRGFAGWQALPGLPDAVLRQEVMA